MASDPRGYYGVGHGHQLFQELLHVPLIIWHPGMKGSIVPSRISLVDTVPSLMDWLQVPNTIASTGVRPVGRALGSIDAELPDDRPIFSSGIAYGWAGTAVVKGRWKSIQMVGGPPPMLFDLESDPMEQKLLQQHDVNVALGQELERYTSPQSGTSTAVPELSQDQIESLKAIGYLDGAAEN